MKIDHVASHAFRLLVCILAASLNLLQVEGQERRPFTVQDDIAITQFGDIWTTEGRALTWSRDRSLLVVHLTSSSLEDGKIHDQLLVYRSEDLRAFAAGSAEVSVNAPKPLWTIESESLPNTLGDPGVGSLTWLEGGNSFAFLQWTHLGTQQLLLADLPRKVVIPLTPEAQDVRSFSIRDRHHFVYTVPSESYLSEQRRALNEPSMPGTGAMLGSLILPERYLSRTGRVDLWTSAADGSTRPVVDPSTGQPHFLYGPGINSLALSRDGQRMVTLLSMPVVPVAWERLYPPPYPEMPFQVRAGKQDLNAGVGTSYLSRYTMITIQSGSAEPLFDSPAAYLAGWVEGVDVHPEWSPNDRYIFFPGAYVSSANAAIPKPCYVVLEVQSRSPNCLEALHGMTAGGVEPGYSRLQSAEFSAHSDTLILTMRSGSQMFMKSTNDSWKPGDIAAIKQGPLLLRVDAGPAQPPRLIATDTATRKQATVLDPNGFLKAIDMGEVRPYRWSDSLGHDWDGLLYMPLGFKKGMKYPLVIQNHGVMKDAFAPSGEFPSAFAAQELASVGIMVLQVHDCSGRNTPREIECNVQAYDSAVQNLARDEMVDPMRVGIVGFSRTVMYVLRSLVTGKVHYRAASITDGVNLGLMEYAETVYAGGSASSSSAALIGAAPVGNGLYNWLQGSPELNVDKIDTPVRVVAKRDIGVLGMWGPYAMLAAAHKPTDLVVLNTHEHTINDPRVRQSAQQGNVDWFRFWLQGFEDSDPQKQQQYERWKKLRDHP